MTDSTRPPALCVVPYGPCFAVVEGKALVAWAVNRLFAEALVEQLDACPRAAWDRWVPDPFAPCFISSIQERDAGVVLAGMDVRQCPVALPVTATQWQALVQAHAGLRPPFWARLDPADGELRLCSAPMSVPLARAE